MDYLSLFRKPTVLSIGNGIPKYGALAHLSTKPILRLIRECDPIVQEKTILSIEKWAESENTFILKDFAESIFYDILIAFL